MKSLVELAILVLRSSGEQCGAPTHRDELTMVRRVAAEGDSFLTITLPSFCKIFDRALDDGRWPTGDLKGFSLDRQGLPKFLSGFLSSIFDTTGTLLPVPSLDSIRAVRQILLQCGKIERPTSPTRATEALRQYVEIDRQVPTRFDERKLSFFDAAARMVCASLGSTFVDPVSSGLIPRHGPGAVAEKYSQNQRYNLQQWPRRMGTSFPMDWFAFVNANHTMDGLSEIDPELELPVRVVQVPKTMKAPRTIAIEPAAMQWVQQSMMKWFYDTIPKDRLLRRTIRFSYQEANKAAALQGSRDGLCTTIDLSEASDRVGAKLVWRLFAGHPELRRAIFACRSTRASVEGYPRPIVLRKFASMGSALCFPVEAIVFATIIAACRLEQKGCQVNMYNTQSVLDDVLVYGDDIIVPTDCAPAVIEWLEAFGLKVNRTKTYGGVNFRESCGGEFFRGEDVTVVRFRKDFPTSLRDADAAASWVATTNQLYMHGYWGAARALRSEWPLSAIKSFGVRTAETSDPLKALNILGKAGGSSGLVWNNFRNEVTHKSWNADRQSLDDVRFILKAARKIDEIFDHAALLKCLTALERKPEVALPWLGGSSNDDDHLTSIVRRGGLSMSRRRVSST